MVGTPRSHGQRLPTDPTGPGFDEGRAQWTSPGMVACTRHAITPALSSIQVPLNLRLLVIDVKVRGWGGQRRLRPAGDGYTGVVTAIPACPTLG